MINLEDFYDEIPLANQYFAQGDFENALEIYSKILDTVNPDEETVPYLYINYANCLIKNSNQYFIEEIQNIHSGFDLSERKDIEDDLENAWNMLEICRNSFVILKDDLSLGKTYFLLGEISLLNNEFRDSIRDYIECISIYKMINADISEYGDVYMSIASSYEFLGDYDMALKYYQESIEVFKAVGMEYSDILDKIEEINCKKEIVPQEIKEEDEDLTEFKDINSNKKRIN
ncbi:hypothetical protein P3W45_001204 [Vairimorpha bombi]|jgi:tetratricopeptide (TPR) repeat protein